MLFLWFGIFASENLKPSGGPLSPEQAAFDTGKLTLRLEIDPESETIKGYAEALFKIKRQGLEVLELALAPGLKVSRVRSDEKNLSFERDGELLLIRLPKTSAVEIPVRIEYAGKPHVAKRPPWDGGFNWSRTNSGKPWVGVSCQKAGGKVWFPCKAHPSDKIDGVSLQITVPKSLYCAANGFLQKIEPADDGFHTFFWEHDQPISTYNISVNIAEYDVIERSYEHAGRKFPLSFYFLKEYQEADQLVQVIFGSRRDRAARVFSYPCLNCSNHFRIAESLK